MHTDLERDAFDILEFFVALAEQDAGLVSALLGAAGIEPGTALPPSPLLKLAAYCRLAAWEDFGLTANASDELPSADSVFMDALAELEGQAPQFEVVTLCQRVHTHALERLAWPHTVGVPAFGLQDRANSSDLLDCVAELLWNFRHLADPSASRLPTTQPQIEAAETK